MGQPVNFSNDLVGIRSYSSILDKYCSLVKECGAVNGQILCKDDLETFLKDPKRIIMGIAKENLPKGVKGLYLAGIAPMDSRWPLIDQLENSPIAVGYERNFDLDRIRGKYLAIPDVAVRKERQSLVISKGRDLAVYGKSRLVVFRDGLDEFLELPPVSLTGLNQDCFL